MSVAVDGDGDGFAGGSFAGDGVRDGVAGDGVSGGGVSGGGASGGGASGGGASGGGASGGGASGGVSFARIADAPLDVAEHQRGVAHRSAGATALFIGTVRDHDQDAAGEVVRLEYSYHPDAEQVLARIAQEVAAAADVRIAVSHRIGSLGVGDHALVAAVSAAHRAEAFDACRDLVERVKHEVPIWKKQYGADGSHAWVGIG